jgi:hypothetical protein
MLKRSLIVAAAVLMVACNSGPSQTADNTVGGANVVSTAKSPMVKATTSFSLDWGKAAKPDQVALADVISYGGSKPTITAPAGWQLIRDDSSKATRQSLYWHAVEANDASTSTWTFSDPVDAQGAILLLDNVAAAPIDMTSGTTDFGGTTTAKSVVTTSDGDLILGFYATDFHLPGLGLDVPANAIALINQQEAPNEFWIVANYQNQNGATEESTFTTPQIFNWAAAQVAIKRGNAAAAASPQ